MIIVCKICGKPFEARHSNTKYCEKCRKKKAEMASHVRSAEEQAKYAYQKTIEQMRAKRNGPSISEIVKAAKEEGVTYGEYVKKHRL